MSVYVFDIICHVRDVLFGGKVSKKEWKRYWLHDVYVCFTLKECKKFGGVRGKMYFCNLKFKKW